MADRKRYRVRTLDQGKALASIVADPQPSHIVGGVDEPGLRPMHRDETTGVAWSATMPVMSRNFLLLHWSDPALSRRYMPDLNTPQAC